MKYLIFLNLILTSTFTAFGQDASVIKETATNQVLLKNATTSEANWQTTNGNQPPVHIDVMSNKKTTSSANLTDQEKQLSENYVDQGESNRILEKNCKDNPALCNGGQVDHKFMGAVDTGLVKAVAQAYATFGAMGDFLPLTRPVGKTPKPDAEKKKDPQDNCKLIPGATEMIATFTQQHTVDALNQGGGTSQKESLLKAAKSHDGRADMAQIQAVGWFSGAACYVYMGSSGQAAWDKSLFIKLGAATLLGGFYQTEVASNKDFAAQTRKIADALPSAGKCNPITQNDCYCAEAENKNDPTYCKAQIAQRNANNVTRTACTDSNMKLDPSCSCEKSNSCFEKFLENQNAVDLQLGMGYSNSPFKAVASLAHGKLEAGTMSSEAFAGSAAIAKKALNEMASKFSSENNSALTLAQKSVSDAIMSKGIPSNIARLMAQNAPSQSAIDKSMAKFSGAGAYQVASYSPTTKSNVLDFSGGEGLGVGGKKADKRGGGADDFLGKLAPKGGATSNAKVLEFAAKAQEKAAQITKSDKPIFEIISIRYQTSGRRLLQLDSNN